MSLTPSTVISDKIPLCSQLDFTIPERLEIRTDANTGLSSTARWPQCFDGIDGSVGSGLDMGKFPWQTENHTTAV